MSKYMLRHDEANCIGCLACEVHCKTQQGPRPRPDSVQDHHRRPDRRRRTAAHALRLHALLPLRGPVVRQGLSDRRHAEAREGRHRLRRAQSLHRLQELHRRLSLGHAAVGPGHAQGGQVRLLHGSRRCRAAAGLRHQVRDRLPVLRRRQRGAGSASRAVRPTAPRRAAGAATRARHERPPDAAGVARRRRRRPGGRRAAGADPRRRAAGPRPGPVPDAPAAAAARAGVGSRRMRRRGRTDLSRLAAIPARPWTVGAGDRRDRPRRRGHAARPPSSTALPGCWPRAC